MDMCDRGIDFVFVSMIRQLDFGSVHTVWYILDLFTQCGIFWGFFHFIRVTVASIRK
jgi:hypothetical protein